MNKILTDCDGVLLDWNSAFDKHMLENYDLGVVNPDTYCIGTRFGKTAKEGRKFVLEFNSSEGVDDLKPLPGAVEAIEKLVQGHNARFDVISALSADPAKRDARHANLVRYFGDVFDEVYCHDSTTSKAQYLQMYDPGHVWLEDHTVNAAIGQALGMHSLVLIHDYNRDEAMELMVQKKVSGCASSWPELLIAIEMEIIRDRVS